MFLAIGKIAKNNKERRRRWIRGLDLSFEHIKNEEKQKTLNFNYFRKYTHCNLSI